MSLPKSLRPLLPSLALIALSVLVTGSALARPEVPGEIQAAANMQCVPLCTLCHLTNPGQKGNWTSKPLGLALSMPIQYQKDIKPAYDAWAQMYPEDAKKVQKGIEPSTGADICGPTYGCAVAVDKEAVAPHDFAGPLWALGAVVAGGLLRRRRRPNAR
jgi:hypothetical protein